MKTSQKGPKELRVRAHALAVNRAAARHVRSDLLRQVCGIRKAPLGPETLQKKNGKLRPIEVPLEVQDEDLGPPLTDVVEGRVAAHRESAAALAPPGDQGHSIDAVGRKRPRPSDIQIRCFFHDITILYK